ncbi:MAG: amidase [Candidatus Methanomethylicia archaeon]
MQSILRKSAIQKILNNLYRGVISAEDIVSESIRKAESIGRDLNYFLLVDHDLKYSHIDKLNKHIREGIFKPLMCIPVAVKDNIDHKPFITRAGTPYLNINPKLNAKIISVLEDMGVVFIGRTNMHELAMGATNVNPHFGPSRNPLDPSRITGGSSGGSAGSVATGITPIALGTDTGGSVRIPAAFCGIVGFKPTINRIPVVGVLPISNTLDHVGILAGNVEDTIVTLNTLINGFAESVYSKLEDVRNRKIRLAVIKDFAEVSVNSVREAFSKALDKIRGLDWEIDEISFPDFNIVSKVRAPIMLGEAAANLFDIYVRYRDRMGSDVRYLFKIGLSIPASVYVMACKIRERWISYFKALFDRYDIIATPTIPIEPPKISEVENITTRALLIKNTELFNVIGTPTITLPAPMMDIGLPGYIQLTASWGNDELLLATSLMYEEI